MFKQIMILSIISSSLYAADLSQFKDLSVYSIEQIEELYDGGYLPVRSSATGITGIAYGMNHKSLDAYKSKEVDKILDNQLIEAEKKRQADVIIYKKKMKELQKHIKAKESFFSLRGFDKVEAEQAYEKEHGVNLMGIEFSARILKEPLTKEKLEAFYKKSRNNDRLFKGADWDKKNLIYCKNSNDTVFRKVVNLEIIQTCISKDKSTEDIISQINNEVKPDLVLIESTKESAAASEVVAKKKKGISAKPAVVAKKKKNIPAKPAVVAKKKKTFLLSQQSWPRKRMYLKK